jgi:hypothetical protein
LHEWSVFFLLSLPLHAGIHTLLEGIQRDLKREK